MSLHTKFKDQCLNVFHVTTCKWELPWCISKKHCVYIYIYIPSGICYIAIENGHLVGWFSIKNGGFFHSIRGLFTRGYLSLSLMICHQLVQWNIPDSDWKPCHWSLDPNWSRKNVVNGTRPHKDLIHFYSGAYVHVCIYIYILYIYTHALFSIVINAIIIQVGWLFGWLVGWTTHSSSRGPQARPPPADLRVSSGNVIAALPASFWWPSRTETGTIREEGRQNKRRPCTIPRKSH